MTLEQLRNTIVRELYKGLGSGPMVLMADQVEPQTPYPLLIYQAVQPYMPGSYNLTRQSVGDPTKVQLTRAEHAEGTYSFTACSINRKGEDGQQIYGDNEALELAEMAQGWFLFAGHRILSPLGIVVVDVTNTQMRSAYDIDETDRRYGFDVRLRYVRDQALVVGTIAPSKITITEKE